MTRAPETAAPAAPETTDSETARTEPTRVDYLPQSLIRELLVPPIVRGHSSIELVYSHGGPATRATLEIVYCRPGVQPFILGLATRDVPELARAIERFRERTRSMHTQRPIRQNEARAPGVPRGTVAPTTRGGRP